MRFRARQHVIKSSEGRAPLFLSLKLISAEFLPLLFFLLTQSVAQVPAKGVIPHNREPKTGILTTLENRGCRWEKAVSAYKCSKNREEDFASYEWFRPDLPTFAQEIARFMHSLSGGQEHYVVVVQGYADCVFHPTNKKTWESLDRYSPQNLEISKSFTLRCRRQETGLIRNDDVAFLRSCLTALLLREALRGATAVVESPPLAYDDPNHCGAEHRAVEIYLRPESRGRK